MPEKNDETKETKKSTSESSDKKSDAGRKTSTSKKGTKSTTAKKSTVKKKTSASVGDKKETESKSTAKSTTRKKTTKHKPETRSTTSGKSTSAKITAKSTTAPKTTAQKSKPKSKSEPKPKRTAPKTTKTKKEPPAKESGKKPEETTFIDSTSENIEQGVKAVGDKTSEVISDITKKTSVFADSFYKRLRESVSEVYEAGTRAADGLVETAQRYTDKYKNRTEIRRLQQEQEKRYTKLGALIFEQYKIVGIDADALFKEKEIKDIINEINEQAKEIVERGKALDKEAGS